jgi:succinyl-CoA synthetase beta subunit
MNIHEYQAKDLFRAAGMKVPRGIPAFDVDGAVKAAEELGGNFWVVKAQIHAGGRGKAGGVKLARSLDEVRAHATEILGKTLVTHQTGPEGQLVRRLYVESGADIAKEFYLGVTLDRATSRLTFMASTEGGVEIETVAEETPEKIVKVAIDPAVGMTGFQARQMGFALGLDSKQVRSFTKFAFQLYDVFTSTDCSLAEINPLVLTGSGEIIALDAKLNFDGNALYRQKAIAELRDVAEEDAQEVEAKKHDLSYIKLNGTVGCMVNGAGLAMATMDIIQHYGGFPANFLDVGGGANEEKVAAAFRIITADPAVKGIFVNIFGGIMKCDVIANGVVAAVKQVGLEVPLVVRLAGTNVELGKKILAESDINVIPADSMADGAKKILEATA